MSLTDYNTLQQSLLTTVL